MKKLYAIFFPDMHSRQLEIKAQGKKFVHYTSAKAGYSILENSEIWLRQPTCMNDFMEVLHGDILLKTSFGTNQLFKNTLKHLDPELISTIQTSYSKISGIIKNDTYIFCLSEHENHEDTYGRLSMWRSYGKSTGVAIVMNQEAFLKETDIFKSYTLPVSYLNQLEFQSLLDKIDQNISHEIDFIESLEREKLANVILSLFVLLAVSIKHPGFAEEKEWRIVHMPSITRCPLLINDRQIINEFPQNIIKFPITNNLERGIDYLDFNNLIDRIIIGPTEYSAPIHKAFVEVLQSKGVQNADKKVIISDIPLRT